MNKKYILSILVVTTFGLYALYARYSPKTLTENPVIISTPFAAQTQTPVQLPVQKSGQYKDGVYTGDSSNAYYGYIQVKATVKNGALADVAFLDYPSDRDTSRRINSRAMPKLRSEAIVAQSAKVSTVSGATDSSGAFRQSLASALIQAKI